MRSSLLQIFDVLFGNQTVPNMDLDWIYQNLRTRKWNLSTIPFHVFHCSHVKDDLRVINACGYWENDMQMGFNERGIRYGSHCNLHKIIHCLLNAGINPAKIHLEQWFRGYRVDVLAEIEKDKQYIIVELGSLSSFNKFGFVDDDVVKAFWFGDNDRFIYSLSAKETKKLRMVVQENQR